MISMNRNTSPVSPFNEADYLNAYKETREQEYPETEGDRFKRIYTSFNDFKTNEIALANGSDEWIQKLMIVFGKGGILTLDPDFFMYQDYANQLGVPIQFVASDEAYIFHLDQILSKINQIRPKLFILSNPQNPTGKQFEEAFLQGIADAMQEINGYFVIDEAYIEFGKNYKRPEGEHIILLRTMSKIYGMAGLRIGMMHAEGETFDLLTKIEHPYPVNNLCLNLASNFLENKERVEEFVAYQLESKTALVKAFAQVKDKIHVKNSTTNFLFTYGALAPSLGEYLRGKGFEARFYDEEKMADVVRYSIINLDKYSELNEAIKEWSESVD